MFHNNILHVFIMVQCLCTISECSVVATKRTLRTALIGRDEHSLKLDCNQYSNDLDILRQFPFPVELNLSPNEYDSYQKSVARLSEDGIFVESITIKNEHLVPSSVFCLSNLIGLQIISTPFENYIVPDALANLKTLKHFHMAFTPIKTMTKQLATLTNLETIIFLRCSITHLPDLNKLHYLKVLNFRDNSLTQMDEISNSNLEILDITANNFIEIPILKNKEQLKILFSGDNPLNSAESIILYPNLETIFLYNATLKSIPSAIDKLQQLVTLGISNNQLTDLPHGIVNLPQLISLDARNNLFSPEYIASIKEAFETHNSRAMLAF